MALNQANKAQLAALIASVASAPNQSQMETCEATYDTLSLSLRNAALSCNPKDEEQVREVEELDQKFIQAFNANREKLGITASLPPCQITATPVFKI